jgi:hypothetical protein
MDVVVVVVSGKRVWWAGGCEAEGARERFGGQEQQQNGLATWETSENTIATEYVRMKTQSSGCVLCYSCAHREYAIEIHSKGCLALSTCTAMLAKKDTKSAKT